MTTAQAFHDYIRGLELKPGEQTEAQDRFQQFQLKLQQRLHPAKGLLSGSYGRGTAIRPLHDIDTFLVLSATHSLAALSPLDCLKRVAAELGAEYPDKQQKLQGRSVNVVLGSIGFDVVPAREIPSQANVFEIPDRTAGRWIPSNPWLHEKICNERNDRAGGMLKPLVKAIKRWNQKAGKPVPSFLLEVIAYDALQSKPASYSSGLSALFAFASQKLQLQQPSCPDPAGIGRPIDEDLDAPHRTEALNRLRGAARDAARAVEMEARGDYDGANHIWEDLLGRDFRAP